MGGVHLLSMFVKVSFSTKFKFCKQINSVKLYNAACESFILITCSPQLDPTDVRAKISNQDSLLYNHISAIYNTLAGI